MPKPPQHFRLASIAILAMPLLVLSQEPREIGDDQPLPHRVSALPISERRRINSAIEPDMANWFKDDDDADTIQDEMLSVERGLRYEWRTIDGHKLLFIHARTIDGCGAVGNCLFFVLDDRFRTLLGGVSAKEFTVLATKHNGLRDILLGGHISASQTSQDLYEFDGHRYKAVRCGIDTHDANGGLHRDFGPCDQ